MTLHQLITLKYFKEKKFKFWVYNLHLQVFILQLWVLFWMKLIFCYCMLLIARYKQKILRKKSELGEVNLFVKSLELAIVGHKFVNKLNTNY